MSFILVVYFSCSAFSVSEKLINLFFFIDQEKQMNASYIISVARKLGCSIFLLPEDILEVTNLID